MNPERKQVLANGLIAGMIGAVAVAVFFGIANAVAGRPVFHTPALLGSWLFYGTTDPWTVAVEPGPVLAFNGVHIVAFLGLGMVAAVVVRGLERGAVWITAALVVVPGFALLSFAVLVLLGAPVVPAISWWSIGGALLFGAAAMGGYLWWAHPRLRATLRLYPAGDVELPVGRLLAETGIVTPDEISSLVWAVARPEAGPAAEAPAGRPAGNGGPTRLAFCPTLSREVRIGRGPDGDDLTAAVFCVDYGAGCTDPLCPLFGVPPSEMAARLDRSRPAPGA